MKPTKIKVKDLAEHYRPDIATYQTVSRMKKQKPKIYRALVQQFLRDMEELKDEKKN